MRLPAADSVRGAAARAKTPDGFARNGSTTASLSRGSVEQTAYTSRPPGARWPATAARISACSGARRSPSSGCFRQRASGWRPTIPTPEHGASTIAPANASSSGERAHIDAAHVHGRGAARSERSRARPSFRSSTSTATTDAGSPVRATSCSVLLPRPQHASRTRAPGCGSSRSAANAAASDCSCACSPIASSTTGVGAAPAMTSTSLANGDGAAVTPAAESASRDLAPRGRRRRRSMLTAVASIARGDHPRRSLRCSTPPKRSRQLRSSQVGSE